ncbi:kelch-like protein 28 [Diadema antillarum]|uniref:kelch-like protein 28 n=1 Tax=Diadema antillarum TaxID=105358 RepID=UPI003A87C8C2
MDMSREQGCEQESSNRDVDNRSGPQASCPSPCGSGAVCSEVPGHARMVLREMHFLQQQGHLCDVTLRVDGHKVQVHRAVLSGCSPYFKAMFTGNLCESEKEEIDLKSVDKTAIDALVDFAYTGKIAVTHANVQSLLPAANLFQMQSVKKLCCDFLQAQLHATNSLGIAHFAEVHACQDLQAIADKFVAANFLDLSQGEEFCHLDFEELTKILSRDDLNVSSEEVVFSALDTWLNYDPNRRQCYLGKLLQCVRLPQLTLKTLTRLYETHTFIKENSLCQEQVNKALQYHLNAEDRLSVARKIKNRLKKRGEISMLCAVGGKNGLFATLDSVEVYQAETDTWREVASLSCRRQECAAAVVNQNLYVIGGVRCQLRNGNSYRCYDNGVERWQPETNAWSTVASMHMCRSNHGVAVLDGRIYALGGYNGESYMKSVEYYCPKSNQWRAATPMLDSRSIFTTAVVDGKIYAIGGYGPNYLSSMERYDPDKDAWEKAAPLNDRRINFGVAVLHGFIYIVGGHNGEQYLSSVERYDPHQNSWKSMSPMGIPRTGLGVTVMGGHIYAAGGHSGAAYLDRVERYDPFTDTWTLVKAMLNCRCNFAFAAL